MKQQTTPALSLEWFLKPRILFMLLGPLLLVYLLIKTIGLYKTAADTAHVSQPQRFQDTTYPSSFLNTTTTTTAAAAFRANNGTSFLRAAGMRNDTQGNINGHHKSHKVGVMTGAAINATSNTTVAAVPATATATAAAASIAATPSSAANSSSTNTTVPAVANATAPANATRQQR
jgi:hypothetical protein